MRVRERGDVGADFEERGSVGCVLAGLRLDSLLDSREAYSQRRYEPGVSSACTPSKGLGTNLSGSGFSRTALVQARSSVPPGGRPYCPTTFGSTTRL